MHQCGIDRALNSLKAIDEPFLYLFFYFFPNRENGLVLGLRPVGGHVRPAPGWQSPALAIGTSDGICHHRRAASNSFPNISFLLHLVCLDHNPQR